MADEKLDKYISKLTQDIGDLSADIKKKETCFPTTIAIAIATPFVLWIILYFMKPSIVMKQDGDKQVRNTTKIFMWTIGLSILVWGGLYGYSKYFGSGKICSRK